MPESSGLPEFLKQVSGLLAFTCAAGLVWVVLMGMIMQRGAERRRRAARGEPPLPGMGATLSAWFQRVTAGQPSAQPDARPATLPPDVPLPDLSMLTGDLTEPEPLVTENPPPHAGEPESSAPVEVEDAVEEAEPAAAPDPIPMPDVEEVTLPSDAVEVLRVWRDITSGELVVEIAGQRARSLAELRSIELEQRFHGVLRDLETLASPPLSGAPRPLVQPAVEDEPLPPRSPSLLRQMSRVAIGRTPPAAEDPVPERGIAEQIEDLLQARLDALPDYRERSIHVKPALAGVRIEVDGRAFEGIGEVDDPAIHALLLDVVREWENQQ